MSWLVFLCSSRFLKPKSSSTSSSSIHMCLICNDFQMWVVWLCSLASSEPKMVFGIAQRTFYLNRRETVIRRGGFTLSIHWTKKRRAILCSWKKQITKVTTVHFISSLLMPNVTMVMGFFLWFHLHFLCEPTAHQAFYWKRSLHIESVIRWCNCCLKILPSYILFPLKSTCSTVIKAGQSCRSQK